LLTIEDVLVGRDVKKAIEARGFYCQKKSFPFLVSLITFDRILTCMSDQMQSSTLDLSLATELVLATKTTLMEYHTTCNNGHYLLMT
jgi:hypothetical protein